MGLAEQIDTDIKDAMRAKDAPRLSALRLARAEILKRQKEKAGVVVDDALVRDALQSMIKQRRDSIEQYEAASRADLAQAERAEMEVLQAYLPAELTDAEIEAEARAAIAAAGASTPQQAGKAMGPLMAKLKATGRPFDGKRVNAIVKALLEEG